MRQMMQAFRFSTAAVAAGLALVAVLGCGAEKPRVQASGDADAASDAKDASHLEAAVEVVCPECDGACGDGKLRAGEGCDDGNLADGDGCNSTCQIEAGWTCPTPGEPCHPS